MSLRSLVALAGMGAFLLSTACGGGQRPAEVVRAFLSAVEAVDLTAAQGLVCEAQRGRVHSVLEPFSDADSLAEAFDLSFDDLTVQEQSNDGNTAIVHVTGTLLVSFLGHQERQAVDEEHAVVREGGRWVICDP